MKSNTSFLNASLLSFVAVSAALIASSAHAAGEFIPLDNPGAATTSITGISGDGVTAIGFYRASPGDPDEAFRWTQSGGMQRLGDLPGGAVFSRAQGVNTDGSVIVGYSSSSVHAQRAFIWTQSGGMVDLGALPGGDGSSNAADVNDNGSVVVGASVSSNGSEAFRWTQAGGMIGLGDLAGGTFSSTANGVNADGTVVVGRGKSANGSEAFRWTQAGGMKGLGDLPGGIFNSEARAVNASGSVVVGDSYSNNGQEAFRWTQATGLVGLGDLSGGAFDSVATDVNADGTVVVGASASSVTADEAFRWTQDSGMQSVVDWLASAGVTVNSYILRHALGVSDDGTVVVGQGVGPNGTNSWLARVVPTDNPGNGGGSGNGGNQGNSGGSGVILLTDFLKSFKNNAKAPEMGVTLPSVVMHGAHHRTLLDYPTLNKDNCAWLNGDFAHYGRDKDADVLLSEAGLCHDFAEGLRAGIGLGISEVDQDLALSGENNMDGGHIMAELDYQLDSAPVILSLTAMHGQWDADIKRGYLNAGLPDISKGKTDVDATSVRVRADWKDAFSMGGVSFSTKAEYTVTEVDVDDYTETTGSFPVRFNDQNHTAKELRLGIVAQKAISEATSIRGTLDAVHRYDDRGPSISGQVIGLFAFDLEGSDIEDDWIRAGVEVDHILSDNALISASLNAASKGEDPDISGAISLKIAF